MNRARHNPERRSWRGRSHKKGGERVVDIRAKEDAMAEEGTTLVEVQNTWDVSQYDLGFLEGYEDHKIGTLPAYTLRAGGIYELIPGSEEAYTRMGAVTDFARGYIAGFVKAHEDTYGG